MLKRRNIQHSRVRNFGRAVRKSEKKGNFSFLQPTFIDLMRMLVRNSNSEHFPSRAIQGLFVYVIKTFSLLENKVATL